MAVALDLSAPDRILSDPAVEAGVRELEAASKKISSIRYPEGINIELRKRDLETELPSELTREEEGMILQSSHGAEISSDDGSILITAQGELGLAYGLFQLCDHIRSERELPAEGGITRPQLPYRIAATGAPLGDSLEGPLVSDQKLDHTRQEFRKRVRKALKYGYNVLVISRTENYIPWEHPKWGKRSARYRKHLEAMIDVAHQHHMKILLMGDEFLYLANAFDGKPSVKDDQLWEYLAAKYRRLLDDCPGLDGVATRIGEIIPRYDFRALDLIHSPEEEPDPRIEERYRKYILTLHRVVVQEYGKIYLNRTWVTNTHEQHSTPQVYEKTFTPEVPEKDLLLAIKLTTGDQWYHCEPFNPTFGVTEHTTIAQGELYSGYQGRGTYIDYPARYFQSAVESAVDRGAKGIFNGVSWSRGLETGMTAEAILYVFSHLGWNPSSLAQDLTKRWASSTFGPEVATEIAEIFLLGSVAVRDGLYLRQVGLRHWQPLRHIRTNDYILEGNPEWDNGRAQDEFLKDLYLECKPWLDQTEDELDHGVAVAERMIQIYQGCRDQIEDQERSRTLKSLLDHGLASLTLNASYVKAFLRYFRYREKPTDENREVLQTRIEKLKQAVGHYDANYDYYQTRAIPAFLDLAEKALEDIERSEKILEQSPTDAQVKEMFLEARREEEEILEREPDAELIASWQGTVDGRDILMINDQGFEIEHISDDQITGPMLDMIKPIPKEEGKRLVIDRVKVRGYVYIKEQPGHENDFTLTVYLQDRKPGPTPFHFDIYAVDE